jgi:hypothetical protein
MLVHCFECLNSNLYLNSFVWVTFEIVKRFPSSLHSPFLLFSPTCLFSPCASGPAGPVSRAHRNSRRGRPLSLTRRARSSAASSRRRPDSDSGSSPSPAAARLRFPGLQASDSPARLFRCAASTAPPHDFSPNPSTRCHLTLVGCRREPAAPVPPVPCHFVAGPSPWSCALEPPHSKEPARVVCLHPRAPRRRLDFVGAPPRPLLAVRRRASSSSPRKPPVEFARACSTSWWRSRCIWCTPAPDRISAAAHRRCAAAPASPSAALRRCRLLKTGAVGSLINGPGWMEPYRSTLYRSNYKPAPAIDPSRPIWILRIRSIPIDSPMRFC